MEGQSGHSELSVISWVSAVEGCPLSGVPLYYMYLADAYSASLSASVLCCLPTIVVVTFDAGSALEVESV